MSPPRLERLVRIARALVPQKIEKTFHTTFIIRAGNIRAIGINKLNVTHPRNLLLNFRKDGIDYRDNVGVHSELSAVLKYGQEDCSTCTFVDIRLNVNGGVLQSKTCVGCMSLLHQVGYKRLYYTTHDGQFAEHC